jgi:hypothetical protein
MYGVAAEVAQKVIVLFEDDNLDSGAGQQQSVNQARGTSAGNTDLGSQNSCHKRRSSASLRSASSPARVTPRHYLGQPTR